MRRILLPLFSLVVVLAGCGLSIPVPFASTPTEAAVAPAPAAGSPAALALAALPIRNPAPQTGYARTAFLPHGWADTDHNGCDQRNDVLRRDLQGPLPARGCVVRSGTLHDPYTGHTITFVKAKATRVQIDHIVALGNAWASGAASWTAAQREAFATDEATELLAVDGPTNEAKGDKDAGAWLPPDQGYRCTYVAKQIKVKMIYKLSTSVTEHAAMAGVLAHCPGQVI